MSKIESGIKLIFHSFIQMQKAPKRCPAVYQDKCKTQTTLSLAQNDLPERMGGRAVNVETEGSSQLFHD